jgi:hypothetical protein
MMSEPNARSTFRILSAGMEGRIIPANYSGALSPIARLFQGETRMNSRHGKNQGS